MYLKFTILAYSAQNFEIKKNRENFKLIKRSEKPVISSKRV